MAEWHDPVRHSGFDHEAHKKERNRRILNAVGTAANVGLAGLGAYHLGKSMFMKAPVRTSTYIPHSHIGYGSEIKGVEPHRHITSRRSHLTEKGTKVKLKLKRK
jgi:hypothetical protein